MFAGANVKYFAVLSLWGAVPAKGDFMDENIKFDSGHMRPFGVERETHNRVRYNDERGMASYYVEYRDGKQEFYDSRDRYIGCIDRNGETWGASNRSLSTTPRPDILAMYASRGEKA